MRRRAALLAAASVILALAAGCGSSGGGLPEAPPAPDGLEAIKEVEGVCDDPAPDVLVVELADFSVNVSARWWTDSRRTSVLAVQSKAIAAIKSRLLENGIDLPFPILCYPKVGNLPP